MFKHSQILKKTLITTSLLTFSLSSHAALTFGNAEEGQLKVSGTVRAKYVYDFDSEPSTSKFSFNDAVLWLDYNSPKWIGRLDYRVYEYYGRLGDANWLTDAWMGYKINLCTRQK